MNKRICYVVDPGTDQVIFQDKIALYRFYFAVCQTREITPKPFPEFETHLNAPGSLIFIDHDGYTFFAHRFRVFTYLDAENIGQKKGRAKKARPGS